MNRETLLRKLNQAYELAGLARQDGDTADAERWLNEAERCKTMLQDLRLEVAE